MATEGFYYGVTRVYASRDEVTIERDGQMLDMPVGEAPLLIEALTRLVNAYMGNSGKVHSTEDAESEAAHDVD